jgi:asparaginyl-tRNA synthetase
MATIHIDESVGSDSTGKGTSDYPYQSLSFAIFIHGPSPPTRLLVRKDTSSTYEEPTQSALKKAKKGADGLEKKKKKQDELALREAAEKTEERERREELLRQSKHVVLKEDETLPESIRVRYSSHSGEFARVTRF